MKTYLVTSLKITALTMILFGVIYPLLITGIATFTAPGGGDGKTLIANGKVVGFEVIGQSFTSDKYFNSRPSAVGYNAASTGGSNKGPTNPEYLAQVEERINSFLHQNPGVEKNDVPVDLVTASGGGLDPHISPKAAFIQVSRIAVTRGVSK
ncbi:MAG TPA: potassium-transporting ATPase subunit C, partial [Cyclobacteriaceae bacterium]|nr:potassium-transporting ATPase subunit C [Cyclobacteriaceae bacterium]